MYFGIWDYGIFGDLGDLGFWDLGLWVLEFGILVFCGYGFG